MDGLLIDSEPLWRRAERLVFADVGVDLSDDDCRSTMGMRIDAVVRHWFERRPWQGASLETVERSILSEVDRLVRAEGEALPGVDHALALFAGEGFRLGLASSSPRSLIDAVLDRLELQGCFEAVRSAADEEHGKPHPAVYLSAAGDLSALPEACIALEDSASGVAAARAAGMSVVAVPEHPPPPDSTLHQADLLLESLAQLDPSVFELVPARRAE